MPYKIQKSGSGYSVVNKNTGQKHSKHTTKAKAEAQFRLLEGIEHGTITPRRKSSSPRNWGR